MWVDPELPGADAERRRMRAMVSLFVWMAVMGVGQWVLPATTAYGQRAGLIGFAVLLVLLARCCYVTCVTREEIPAYYEALVQKRRENPSAIRRWSWITFSVAAAITVLLGIWWARHA